MYFYIRYYGYSLNIFSAKSGTYGELIFTIVFLAAILFELNLNIEFDNVSIFIDVMIKTT